MNKLKIGIVLQPSDSMKESPDSSIVNTTYELAKRINKTYDITIFHRTSGKLPYRSIKDYATFYNVPVFYDQWMDRHFLRKIHNLISQRGMPYYYSYFFHLIYTIIISFYIRRNKIDIVRVINFANFAPIIKLLNPTCEIILHMRCEWLSQLNPDVIKKYLKYVDHIVGCSNYVTHNIINTYDNSDECSTIYNGVDEKTFGLSVKEKDKNVLLYVGRISPEKGVHTLIESMAIIKNKFPDIKLFLIGGKSQLQPNKYIKFSADERVKRLIRFYSDSGSDLSYYDYLNDLVNKNNLLGNIFFLNIIPNNKLSVYYQNASIFIYPSIWDEPFGNPPIEAMATGTPVIATESGGIAETVSDGVTGFLINKEDSRGLAQKIDFLLSNQDLIDEYGRNGRLRVEEKFTWNKIAGNFLTLYRTIYAGLGVGKDQSAVA